MSDKTKEQVKQWPPDLIAFKWADTLPREIQEKLLVGQLSLLQLAINEALKGRK